VDFTREPIIQTVITPKEGCKIVVRSSKNSGQEEFFVDAVEVVSFGTAIFFRSLERPKSFLVPASDYEILEVRETRMVLKNVGIDRAIKIGGGRDATVRGGREPSHDKHESVSEVEAEQANEESKGEAKAEPARLDKKRDRRRNARRRRGRDELLPKEGDEEASAQEDSENAPLSKSEHSVGEVHEALPLTSVLTSLLPPPPTLISETIARYRDNASFKSAFFSKEEEPASETTELEEEGQKEEMQPPFIELEQPEYGSFQMTEEEEEEIYRMRQLQREKEREETEPKEEVGHKVIDAAPSDHPIEQEKEES
jgi:hypothetical protein